MILFLNSNLRFVQNEYRFSENLAKSPQSQISVLSQIEINLKLFVKDHYEIILKIKKKIKTKYRY